MNYCIAGIHTGTGKTVCSAVICQALGYDYWKPVQAGDLHQSDSMFIRDHVANPKCVIHPERYRLQTAASPHYAAALENITIKKEDFILPKTDNHLIIETAGGIFSPLSDQLLNTDLMALFNAPVIVVSGNYLGSINHTLMTVEILKNKNIPLAGIVFSGPATPASEDYILQHTGLNKLFAIPPIAPLNKESIRQFTLSNRITIG